MVVLVGGVAGGPRFGHGEQHQQHREYTHRRQCIECNAQAEMIREPAGRRCAQGTPDPDAEADQAERQIEVPATARDVADDERHHDPEARAADAVESLHRDDQGRVG
jgi:hypothetical protein